MSMNPALSPLTLPTPNRSPIVFFSRRIVRVSEQSASLVREGAPISQSFSNSPIVLVTSHSEEATSYQAEATHADMPHRRTGFPYTGTRLKSAPGSRFPFGSGVRVGASSNSPCVISTFPIESSPKNSPPFSTVNPRPNTAPVNRPVF